MNISLFIYINVKLSYRMVEVYDGVLVKVQISSHKEKYQPNMSMLSIFQTINIKRPQGL